MNVDRSDFAFYSVIVAIVIAGLSLIVWATRPTEFELQVNGCANMAHEKGANRNQAYFECWKAIQKKNEDDAKRIVDQVLKP